MGSKLLIQATFILSLRDWRTVAPVNFTIQFQDTNNKTDWGSHNAVQSRDHFHRLQEP